MRIFMAMSITTAVVGASGYAGAELLRIIHAHPEFDLVSAMAGSNAGESIASVHPGLIGLPLSTFSATSVDVLSGVDLVFLALPHGESAKLTEQISPHVRVVDLGADHRLMDPVLWQKYYGDSVAAEGWVYGLPELPGKSPQVCATRKVANPGCYATAIELGIAPLLVAGLGLPDDIVCVASSGTSGAGRKASVPQLATEVMGSLSPYRIAGKHQHLGEITQELSAIAQSPVSVSFTPVLAPMPRGILATTTVKVVPDATVSELREAFEKLYADSPFVHLLPTGQMPRTADTAGTNNAHIQVELDEEVGRAVVVTAIDNLGKGASGQAVQNANLMFDLDPAAGLKSMAVAP